MRMMWPSHLCGSDKETLPAGVLVATARARTPPRQVPGGRRGRRMLEVVASVDAEA